MVFLWGTSLFIRNSRPPAASTEIFVVGKQWMWKLQHPEGVEEINELHVPVNRPIKLTMTSEDVIHDFSVPAFRVKKDVVPGMYTSLWFQATKTGRFDLYCDQYCGTNHSLMRGEVIVMEPTEYEQWLSGGIRGGTMAQSGAKLYDQLACITCHGTGKGPSLNGYLWQTGKADATARRSWRMTLICGNRSFIPPRKSWRATGPSCPLSRGRLRKNSCCN